MRRHLWFLLLTAVMSVNALIAQKDANVDSLHKVLTNASDSSVIFTTRINLANYYIYHNLDSTDRYISSVINYPEVERFLPEGYSQHLLVKAWLHQGRQELEQARDLMLQVDSLRQQHGDRKSQIIIQTNLASILLQLRDTTAMDYVLKVQSQLDTSAGKSEREAWLMNQYFIGRIYGDKGNYEQAIKALITALEAPIYTEFPEMRDGIFNTLGIYLEEIGNLSLAVKYLREALAQTYLYDYEQKSIMLNLAGTNLKMGELDSSLHYLNKIDAKRPFNKDECRRYNLVYAKLNYKLEKFQSALGYIQKTKDCSAEMQSPEIALINTIIEAKIRSRLGDLGTADNLWRKAQSIMDEHEGLQTLINRTDLAKLSLQLTLARYIPDSLKVLDRYAELRNEQAELEADRKLKELLIAYETLEKEKENEVLKRDNKIQMQANRLQRFGLLGLALFAIAVFVIALFWRRNLILIAKNNQLLQREKQALVFERDELIQLNADLKERIRKSKIVTKTDPFVWTVQGVDKTYRLVEDEIYYGQAEDEGVRLYLTGEQSIWIDQSLKDTLVQLPHFMRIHRKVMVNPKHITAFSSRALTIADGTELPVGRRYKPEIMGRLQEE